MSQFLLNASTGITFCYNRHRILLQPSSRFATTHSRRRSFATTSVTFCYIRHHVLLHPSRPSYDPRRRRGQFCGKRRRILLQPTTRFATSILFLERNGCYVQRRATNGDDGDRLFCCNRFPRLLRPCNRKLQRAPWEPHASGNGKRRAATGGNKSCIQRSCNRRLVLPEPRPSPARRSCNPQAKFLLHAWIWTAATGGECGIQQHGSGGERGCR